MMTDDERNKLERMLQHADDGSRKLAHKVKLLTELRSVVVDDRPDHALLLRPRHRSVIGLTKPD